MNMKVISLLQIGTALTTKYDKTENLKQDVKDVVMDWLACGIDPEVSTIYVQSLVPEIAELNIYLGMVTPQNWVERDPTLKDMAKNFTHKRGRKFSNKLRLNGLSCSDECRYYDV